MIELKDFSKNYKNFSAVKNLSAVFESNCITGILGPNGAGKTTILKALSGRHFATAGSVLISEGDFNFEASDNPQLLRNLTGFVEEIPNLALEYTVKEYISMCAALHNAPAENVEKTIKLCSLTEKQDQKIKSLSKGYMERVNFAQALVYEPKILILDEPASGLDPQQILKMRELVKKLAENHTIILSTHLMQEVEALCDKVLIINKGKLLQTGTIKEICRNLKTKTLEEAFFNLVGDDKNE